jgi:hypothetical protein
MMWRWLAAWGGLGPHGLFMQQLHCLEAWLS